MNSRQHLSFVLAALAGLGFCLSCGGGEGGNGGEGGGGAEASASVPEPPEVSAEAMDAARDKFNSYCYTCHGKSGTGDGPASASLTPKPRDYTDVEWQNSVTNEQLAKTIVEGGAAVGLSSGMPTHSDLEPEVVDGLVAIIRGFGGQ